jgi:hypothetical protein
MLKFVTAAVTLGGVALIPFMRLVAEFDEQLGCELLGDDD